MSSLPPNPVPPGTRACTVDPPAWTSFPPVEDYKVFSQGDYVDISNNRVMQVPYEGLFSAFAGSKVWGRAGSYSWGSYWEWAFWDGCDIDWYATPGGAYYMASCTDFGARWGEDFQNGWDKWGVVTSDPSKVPVPGLGLVVCIPGSHQLTLSWQDKPKMGNWSVDGVDIENPATVDASGSANTTVNLIVVFMIGAPLYLRYGDTCEVTASPSPSPEGGVLNYNWTASGSLAIVDPNNPLQTISGPMAGPNLPSVTLKGISTGPGTVSCDISFKAYPQSTDPNATNIIKNASGIAETLVCDVRLSLPNNEWDNNGACPVFRYNDQMLAHHWVRPLSGSVAPLPPLTYKWECLGDCEIDDNTSPSPNITPGCGPSVETITLHGYHNEQDTGISNQKMIEVFETHLDRDMANIYKLNEPRLPLPADGSTPSVNSNPGTCGGACCHGYMGTIDVQDPNHPFTPIIPGGIIYSYVIYSRSSNNPNCAPENPLDHNDWPLLEKGDVVKFEGFGNGVNHVSTIIVDGCRETWEYNGHGTAENGIARWGYSSIDYETDLLDSNGHLRVNKVTIFKKPLVQ